MYQELKPMNQISASYGSAHKADLFQRINTSFLFIVSIKVKLKVYVTHSGVISALKVALAGLLADSRHFSTFSSFIWMVNVQNFMSRSSNNTENSNKTAAINHSPGQYLEE